jgi:hypothetical protein
MQSDAENVLMDTCTIDYGMSRRDAQVFIKRLLTRLANAGFSIRLERGK